MPTGFSTTFIKYVELHINWYFSEVKISANALGLNFFTEINHLVKEFLPSLKLFISISKIRYP